MFKEKTIIIIFLILSLSGSIFGADVILNEYNAVDADEFLNGGTSSADLDGGRASDSYFGRIRGNGGDWFELVVITDHLDMRNWRLEILQNGVSDETLVLTNHVLWSDLRSGTIITVSEDVPTDVSYNPAAGDWWINVQARDGAGGVYIEASSFPVSSNNWQLIIRKPPNDVIVFGPVGEGVSPTSGIGNTEVFRLKADPDSTITRDSADYDDGKDFSTFGAPNRWGNQSLSALRTVPPAQTSLTVTSPNGSEIIKGGTSCDIIWDTNGTISKVLVEFSLDSGISWQQVYPPNAGNTGTYQWLVPIVNSENCLVRIANAANPTVYDTSNETFTIFECELDGDLTGDCIVDIYDLAIFADMWLECANPYNPDC